jgi:hypothetical protein
MKIFKNTSLTDEIMQSVSVGETVITKGNREHEKTGAYPYAHFFVLQCTSPGAFPYQGGFNNLKNAVTFAASIERPDLVNSSFQTIEMAGGQKMVIYYIQSEEDVVNYIDAIDHISSEACPVGQSGISIRFIHPEVSMAEQMSKQAIDSKRQDLVLFGQYMMSEERRKRFASHPEFGDLNLDHRLAVVHDRDFGWFEEYRKIFRGESKEPKAEQDLLYQVKLICEESLSPEGMQKFDDVVKEIVNNRKGLKGN